MNQQSHDLVSKMEITQPDSAKLERRTKLERHEAKHRDRRRITQGEDLRVAAPFIGEL